MRTLPPVWSFTTNGQLQQLSNDEIRAQEACPVWDFQDLMRKVAQLQYSNSDHLLLYRGLKKEYVNVEGNNHLTTLKPSLFHTQGNHQHPHHTGRFIKPETPNVLVEQRFNTLNQASNELVRLYQAHHGVNHQRMTRYRILQWAILQHYGVCGTPLLDVTQSLRVAASFACLENATDYGFVHVLAVPNLSGTLTASAEADLQVIRLASICPPTAQRPHIQQGLLIGEYPELATWGQKQHYPQHEVDPARRLVAKFRLDPRAFMQGLGNYPMLTREDLYPAELNDPLAPITAEVHQIIQQNA